MAEIIKTWPATMDAKKVARIFSREGAFARYYFTLGRGKPKQPVTRIWYTWRGRILGSFAVIEIVQNDGSLPQLRSLDGRESEWQIKPDAWVAVCEPRCERLRERLFFGGGGFQGWRYFDLATYRSYPEARIRF